MNPESVTVLPYPGDAEFLAGARGADAAVARIYRPAAPAVVLGAAGRPEVELDLAGCRAAGIPVLRRAGGGCAVVVDPGDVIVSVAYHAPGFTGSRAHFEVISRWLLAALGQLGIQDAYVESTSDLVLDDRKFAGACIHRAGGLLHYGACLLVEPDLALMDQCLRHPPRTPAYRRGRSHRDFVRPLGVRPGGWTAPRLEAALAEILDPVGLWPPAG